MEGRSVSGKGNTCTFFIGKNYRYYGGGKQEDIMRAMGIDIGTTTISVILVDGQSGELLGSRTVSHQAFIQGEHFCNRVQDPEKLYEVTRKVVVELAAEIGKPDSIGFTGQMHGILYVDREGRAATPLYTWQDESGNEKFSGDKTYEHILREKVGAAATGYGMTTHFFLCHKKEIPEKACCMTTISDYIAMRFCNRIKPIIARDMAASWGCFDLEKGKFLKEKLEMIGIRTDYIPEICEEHEIIGMAVEEGLEGVPVMASLGDNQASFIGSVQNIRDTVVINIGTGSQVSFGTNMHYRTEGSIELRPCIKDSYLLVGAGLCGGRAYAMLEQFYRQIAAMEGENIVHASLYESMEKQAREFVKTNGIDEAWDIRTTFSGTRTNPGERGSITSVGVKNFTPGAMTAGMIKGILEELYDMYQGMCQMTGKKATCLVGAGNGIRKNRFMQEMAETIFGMKLNIPKCHEEAALGAAFYSLVSSGKVDSLEEIQKKIQYI